MVKVNIVVIFFCLLFGLSLCNKTVNKEIYYKQTTSTAGIKIEQVSKEEIPIIMEGQSPKTELVKLNSLKNHLMKQYAKKESKTVPRKGVLLNKSSEKLNQNDTAILDPPLDIRPVVENVNVSLDINKLDQKLFANDSKILINTGKSNTVLNKSVNNSVPIKTVRKPKPKPEVTIGGQEIDEPMPASPTNKSPLGMPRKMDYIVPVVITITALPLLGVAFYVLYKRGRDYWDKRHYRRMDFLIDGMYNE